MEEVGRVVAVSVGMPREVLHGSRRVRTGIFKSPVAGRVAVGRLGLAGDGQADLESHGGEDKAVYLYPVAHWSYWSEQLGGRSLGAGELGENLSVEGCLEDMLRVGDVLRVGSARLQVSQPRTPCFKLGIRMGSGGFPKRFLASLRTGFYARVLESGELAAGDTVLRESSSPESPSVRAICRLLHFERDDRQALLRASRAPGLSASWRRELEGLARGLR